MHGNTTCEMLFIIVFLLFFMITLVRSQDYFIGEIKQVGFNFAPRGWALCNGQLLPINQNSALFSLLGTTYGGNGVTTFALPDLRGRVSIHQGQGPGLSNQYVGVVGGSETKTLLVNNLPTHAGHMDSTISTVNASILPSGLQSNSVCSTTNANVLISSTPCSNSCGSTTGSHVPFSIMQPYIITNFIIATEGIYPVRD
jgi:microcystin-dependent protein